jgi:Domain of unknown function (DUF4157)
MQRMTQRAAPAKTEQHRAHAAPGARAAQPAVPPRFISNQSRLRQIPPRIQAKLEIGPVDDPLEREADAVADKVMRMTDIDRALSRAPPQVSRKCPACEEENKKKLQMKSEGGGRFDGTEAPQSVHQMLQEPGRPLDANSRVFFEPRFGVDFSEVRIHSDQRAAESARAVGAQAYAVRNHVALPAFDARRESAADRWLLAHELAHVTQQSGTGPVLQRQALEEVAPANVAAPDQAMDPDSDTEVADGVDGGSSGPEIEADSPPTPKAGAKRSNVCAAGDCPQGKQKKVTHDDCGPSGPADTSNFITELKVNLKSGQVQATWSNGGVDTWPCTGHPGVTPTKDDVVGVKCTAAHTNLKKDGMAWFTGFQSQGLRIGFHDSQPVGPGFVSHACVRVCCDKAKVINANSSSGKTKITFA